MKSHFTSDFFANNRARLRQLADDDSPIVIAGNGLMQRGADSTYAFAQDASFWYLTGIDEPDITLVMDNDREYLIVPERDTNRQTFDGQISDEQLTLRSKVQTVFQADKGWLALQSRLQNTAHVATLAPPPAYIEQHGMYTNPGRNSLVTRLKQYNRTIDIIDISHHLSSMRMVKQAPELRAIKRAIAITVASVKQATTAAKMAKYRHEYEIEAELSKGFRRRGSSGHAFEPIVASGERACTLHNVANNGELALNQLVILDVGAEVEHYAADISRTYSTDQSTDRQRTVHAAVLDVQSYAMSLLKPGVFLQDYEHDVETYMGKKLIELGLIETIEHDAIRRYYPHATSHFLGLNVHDTGLYKEPLVVGTVLTVEPGIYIPEEAIGVRIEDDVVVTKTGIRVLSNALSRELQ